LKCRHVFATFENNASGFVAKNAVSFYDERADATGFPEVNV
jgi:hypothetical protein